MRTCYQNCHVSDKYLIPLLSCDQNQIFVLVDIMTLFSCQCYIINIFTMLCAFHETKSLSISIKTVYTIESEYIGVCSRNFPFHSLK